MTALLRHFLTGFAVTLLIAAGMVAAQAQLPESTVPPVPQPSAPPPPSLAVPKVPQLDTTPAQPAPRAARRSFNKRIDDCATDATAARLDPTERAAYARTCANRE